MKSNLELMRNSIHFWRCQDVLLSNIFIIPIYYVTVGIMWKPTDALPMTVEQRRMLEGWIRARTTPQRMVLRSKICLGAADGRSNNAIAKELETSRPTVLLWRERFLKEGVWGLSEDAPHGPSAQRLDVKKVKAIVETTLQTTPPGATQWSTRTMAEKLGVSHSSVGEFGMPTGCSSTEPRRSSCPKTDDLLKN